MTLGNKELFHSDLWAWLVEQKPAFARLFFTELPSDELKVKREEGHRDITVWCEKKAYVIENKLKSMATREQLEKYQNALNKKFGGGVLTGIEEEPPFELPNGWKYIPYSQIAGRIKEIADTKEPSADKTILSEYAAMLRAIIKILSVYREENKDEWPHEKQGSPMRVLRLYDLFQKYSADLFKKQLESDDRFKKWESQFQELGCTLSANSGFTRGQALVDAKIQFKGSPYDFDIIIQIQGAEYRWCVVRYRNKKMQSADKQNIFDDPAFKDFKGWFSDYKKNKQIEHNGEPHQTSMRDICCRYSDSCTDPAYQGMNYWMVYQYYTLKDYNFASIKNTIFRDLEKAHEICKELCKKD